MKVDLYTKAVLTIIAFALIIIAFKETNIITNAKAIEASNTSKLIAKYGIIPVNSDGTINVHIESSSRTAFYNAEPIEVKIKE